MADIEAILNNPVLYKDALMEGEKNELSWHTKAHNPLSSQVYCLSAFGSLRLYADKEKILNDLFGGRFKGLEPGTWTIQPEVSDSNLLGESGLQQTTSIDMLFTSEKAVICMESKYIEDARDGFGGCSQYKKNCKGFYGPGSDQKCGTQAWCRLENWDGRRSPRMYWSLGKAYFQPKVFKMQVEGDTCPFYRHNYQLMRNVLFAATFSEKRSLPYWGVVAICPKNNEIPLKKQIQGFKEKILLPEFQDRIQLIHYEDYIRILKSYPGEPSKLGDHLETHLPK